MTFSWEHPDWLWGLLSIPLFTLVWVLHELWIKRALNRLGEAHLRHEMMSHRSVWRRVARNISALIALAATIIAIANPQKPLGEVEVETVGMDIIFAVDMSRSMLTQDIRPSRLEVAKEIVRNTIGKSAGDRFGIIAFSSEAYPQLPITTDHGAAEMTLNNMSPDYLPSSGSDVRSAIRLGIHKFDTRLPQDRALIILSDGEDHEGDWEPIVQNAVDSGIFVYTVGLGTETGGPIPSTRRGEYHHDNNGEVVISKRNSTVLRQIAHEGRGEYFDGDKLDVADHISEALETLQRTQLGVGKKVDMEDLFQFPLGVAILFLLARTVLSERSSDTLKKWLKSE